MASLADLDTLIQGTNEAPPSVAAVPGHVPWHAAPGGGMTDLSDTDYAKMTGLPAATGLPPGGATVSPQAPGSVAGNAPAGSGSALIDSLVAPTGKILPSLIPPATENAPTVVRPELAAKMDLLARGAEGPVEAPKPPLPGRGSSAAEGAKEGDLTGYAANIGKGLATGIVGTGDVVSQQFLPGLNLALKTAGLPEIPNNSELAEMLLKHIQPATQGERLAGAAARGAGGMIVPAAMASRAISAAGGAASPFLSSVAQSGGAGGLFSGAVGGVTGEVAKEAVPDRFKGLAEILGNVAGGAAAALPIAGVTAAGGAARNAIVKAANPSEQIPRLIGEQVLKDTGGTPNFTTAPGEFSGVPLTVAQATPGGGSPALSRTIDTMYTQAPDLMKATESAQNQNLHAVLERYFPMTPGARSDVLEHPQDVMTAASTRFERGARGLQKISSQNESRLWNTPALSEPRISTRAVAADARARVGRIVADDVSLAPAMDSAPVQAALRVFDHLPDKSPANAINKVSSALRTVQRDINADATVRVAAGKAATAVQEALWDAPEVAGRPDTFYHPQIAKLDEATGGVVPDGVGPAVRVPGIKADPELVRDLTAARAFTKREAQVLGHASFDSIYKRNSAGNQTLAEGTGLDHFMNFARGVGKQGDIPDTLGFLRDITSEVKRLDLLKRDGEFDPVQIDSVATDLATGLQDYALAKMYKAITTNARDLGEKPIIDANQAINFVKNNARMLADVGAISKDQQRILNSFRDTMQMIKSEKDLQRTRGPQTAARLLAPKVLSDVFLPPLARRMVPIASAGAGAVLTHLFGEGAIGGMIMSEMAGAGAGATAGHYGGNAILNRLYEVPHEKLLEAMREAYHNPKIASDLARDVGKNAPPFRPSAATVAWLRTLLAAQPGTQETVH